MSTLIYAWFVDSVHVLDTRPSTKMELLDIDRIDVDNMALNLATDLEQMQQYMV